MLEFSGTGESTRMTASFWLPTGEINSSFCFCLSGRPLRLLPDGTGSETFCAAWPPDGGFSSITMTSPSVRLDFGFLPTLPVVSPSSARFRFLPTPPDDPAGQDTLDSPSSSTENHINEGNMKQSVNYSGVHVWLWMHFCLRMISYFKQKHYLIVFFSHLRQRSGGCSPHVSWQTT